MNGGVAMLTDPDISHVADDELDRAIAERNEEMKAQADLSEISADDKRKNPPSVTGTG